MSAARFLDSGGPPRKKMRKGTKSCTECRRRKIRCTYDSDRPNICNECHSRGFECIDQEHGTLDPKVTGLLSGEQSYSLRERVTQLENVVRDILQQMEHTTPSSASASPAQYDYLKSTNQKSKSYAYEGDSVSKSAENASLVSGQEMTVTVACETVKDAPITESHQIENAPVLQILNNNVVSRTEGTATRNQNVAATLAISPKAIAARNELVKLIPPRGDLRRIRDLAANWWSVWHYMFPEVPEPDRSTLMGERDYFEIPKSPGEVAKFLLCHLMCIDQLPADFDYNSLERPIVPNEYGDDCVNAIDRLIINDEDLCGTLPSLEAILLLSKWYTSLGRPRKAWLMTRRGIELAQLAGLHISTARDPHPEDTLYNRRLKLWTMLGLNDRFLCLILGLPYGIQENIYRPQVERRLRTESPNMESYCLQLSLIMGPIIDRNQQDPANMSIAETLKVEQEMETQARSMPDHFWQEQPPRHKMSTDEAVERVMLPFMFHYMRATLHLPFMLQSHGNRSYRFSQQAALESSRNAMRAYNRLRSEGMMSPYVCRLIDFQAFSVAMLLIINLIGYSEDSPNHSPEQDEKDWALVDETTEVIRHAAAEPAGTVARQSLLILEGISSNVDKECPSSASCKISVPYFGSVTVTPGKKACKTRPERPSTTQQQQPTPTNSSVYSQNCHYSSSVKGSTSEQPSPFQLYTPPHTNIDFSNVSVSICSDQQQQHHTQQSQSQQQSLETTPSYWDDSSRVQLESLLTLPNAGMMPNANIMMNEPNTAYMNGFMSGLENENVALWPNMNLDLDLDQGWNFDWSNADIIQ
ncbi:C6 finger domain protein, putative [Talaromyces stipitatus ATCC 10500]|uniref:C6 finger domain protein, putative n=1 Tax=Talaromyces stipitatus (strain ATCC 10500 / CBS 375.48 / QM 6759 / NRRL 1006) TaxID=441959 RepID=B8MK23_TALSN|nr:C6 finger domain protein, putative [Talaromyces stipitatus ATCC 10500]EED14840.1 C6 finger domain protein, putative [Talaromyces stipitatus ATCC 10500]